MIKYIIIILMLSSVSYSKENFYIKAKDLKLIDLVNITSKAIDINFIVPNKFDDNIYLIQNITMSKDKIFEFLKIVLKQNNYKIIKHNNIYEIAKIINNENNNNKLDIANMIKEKNDQSIAYILENVKKENNNTVSYFIKYLENIKKENNNTMSNLVKNLDSKYKKLFKKNISKDTITKVIHLKNAKASNIQNVLSPIINKKGKEDTIIISSDDESNSVILIGPKLYIENISSIINELDDYRAQIYITTKIIEVSKRKTDDIGLKYSLNSSFLNEHSIFTLASSIGNELINMNTSNIGLDIPTLKNGIILGASLNLLNFEGALNVVSSPSLLCINNKQSSIYIGETKSFKIMSKISGADNLSSESFARKDIGLRLTITPRISDDTSVLLDINTIIEDVRTTTTNGQPDTSKKEIKTTALVKTGESVIIGGLTKNIQETSTHSLAGLSKIPYIGKLFTSTYTINDKINLVIIVTPYIVPKSKDLSYIREQLSKIKQLEDNYTKKILEKFNN